MHPFEKSGLGTAPFRCVGVTKNMFSIPGVPEATKPGGSCDYCGTSIVYEYWILAANGNKFKVGCDCVAKTGGEQLVEGVRTERLKLARAQRETKRQEKYTARKAKWEAEAVDKRAMFVADNAAFVARLEASATTDAFAAKLLNNLNGWGSLTGPQMDAMQRGWDRADAKAQEKATSKHVGQLTKRHTDTFTISHVTSRQVSQFPLIVSYWHLLKDSQGNVCTYRGSKFLGERGGSFKATFTVKEHTEYQGTAQTVLARPKLTEDPHVKGCPCCHPVVQEERDEPGHEDFGRDDWKLEAHA